MLEILHAIGPQSWVSAGNPLERREAIQELFFDHPVCPDDTAEDWPEDRELYAEMVVVKGESLVGTAMLVVDPDREDRPARIWGMGVLPEFRTDFVIRTLEEALITAGYLDPAYPFIEATDGMLVPNPYSDMPGLSRSDPRAA
ncbi:MULTISPECIES: GNAT family N-acetyltransferase [unclassified Celeribacter]|uniref:GNAT family N-acetyltransferase n=1 Tax=unclassified Celeribacter TaxID=2618893 RepID=UPI001430EF77|nr:GNAT family N-acetyltransferase [Celeribacter sp. HF31]NIY80226.1 GNAT family N-acetyltransferase [Celeribacter sp. HF31]